MKYKYCGLYQEKQKQKEEVEFFLKLDASTARKTLRGVNENGEIIDDGYILYLDEDGINLCSLDAEIAKALNLPLDENSRVKVYNP